jgi:membrane associated rhomboid family serine protease
VIPLADVNPTRRRAVLTIGLISACTLVFAFQSTKPSDGTAGSQEAFICEYGMIADHVVNGADPYADACQRINQERGRLTALVTSQFLHGDVLHLVFNMLFLWVFGNNIEDRMGRLRFLPFFLICGIAAALAQAMVDPDSAIPLIGASGAISGVLGAYLVLYPRVGIWTVVVPFVFLPFKLPAWIWLAVYFGLQFVYLGGSSTSGGGGVAYMAHIGGFAAGALLVKPFLWGRGEPRSPGPAVGYRF